MNYLDLFMSKYRAKPVKVFEPQRHTANPEALYFKFLSQYFCPSTSVLNSPHHSSLLKQMRATNWP